jgi:hypothetical protein
MNKKHNESCQNCMKECGGDITSRSPLHIRYLGMGTIGLIYFLMFAERLEYVRNAKGLLVNISLSPYLSSL